MRTVCHDQLLSVLTTTRLKCATVTDSHLSSCSVLSPVSPRPCPPCSAGRSACVRGTAWCDTIDRLLSMEKDFFMKPEAPLVRHPFKSEKDI